MLWVRAYLFISFSIWFFLINMIRLYAIINWLLFFLNFSRIIIIKKFGFYLFYCVSHFLNRRSLRLLFTWLKVILVYNYCLFLWIVCLLKINLISLRLGLLYHLKVKQKIIILNSCWFLFYLRCRFYFFLFLGKYRNFFSSWIFFFRF